MHPWVGGGGGSTEPPGRPAPHPRKRTQLTGPPKSNQNRPRVWRLAFKATAGPVFFLCFVPIAPCAHLPQPEGNRITSQRLLDQSQAGVFRGKRHIPPILGLFGPIHVPYPKGLNCWSNPL